MEILCHFGTSAPSCTVRGMISASAEPDLDAEFVRLLQRYFVKMFTQILFISVVNFHSAHRHQRYSSK